MPGLMQDFPGPGKLKAAANVASAESRTKYFAFETAALQTAFAVKQAYYQLWFLDEKIRINRETLDLLADLEKIARAQNEVGKVTLQDVYRAQIEQDRLDHGDQQSGRFAPPADGAIQRRAGPDARPTGPGDAGPF